MICITVCDTTVCVCVYPCVCVWQELVEYYQAHSLKESFKLLDTTLRHPYKARERSLTRASSRSPGTHAPNATAGRR